MPLGEREAAALDRCVGSGGLVVFPADTVYGLACDPENPAAVDRLYELKGRPALRPAAVMFFSDRSLLAALPELGERTRAALRVLLPGAVTLLVSNSRRRFPLACGPEPERLGLRAPALPAALAALAMIERPVLQSSANRSGAPDARRLEDVAAHVRHGADLVLDGGELPGTPSTVVDLTRFEADGAFAIVRAGAVSEARVTAALGTVAA